MVKKFYIILFCLSHLSVLYAQKQIDTTTNFQSIPDLYIYGDFDVYDIKSSQISTVKLPIDQVRTIPFLLGEIDIMKSLQKIPGVQSSGDGMSGIYVRGGEYDQNHITLDGVTLYNVEHMNGFVSAINPDITDYVTLYKGGFPARYGERLSSTINVHLKDGDFKKIHGNVNIGLLSSKIQIDGPIYKNKTSFNIAGRISYFNAILAPVLKNIYDDSENLRPYANMNYYDINAKIVHRFSKKGSLSAIFYMGRDKNNTSPSESNQYTVNNGISHNNKIYNGSESKWSNMATGLSYTHNNGNNLYHNSRISFSRYDHKLINTNSKEELNTNLLSSDIIYFLQEKSILDQTSKIKDLSFSSDFHKNLNRHNIRWGAKISLQNVKPAVDIYKERHRCSFLDEEKVESSTRVDTLISNIYNLLTLSLYVEDDFILNEYLKMNLGLRYSFYNIKKKSYHSIEPRASIRYLIYEKMSIKTSYSRISQGIHLLSSNNLVMPSCIWVPITENLPLMFSDQFAIGYNFEIKDNINLTLEGYYKKQKNLIEYLEGASFTNSYGNWEDLIATGDGKAYGIEFLLEKTKGKTTGLIGYTLSKSLRKFDSPDGVINGGDEFYADNDQRHNLNITVSQNINEHWNISGTWTFQTGRRGTITTTSIYGGNLDEYDAYGDPFSSEGYKHGEISSPTPERGTFFDKYLMYYTHNQRNGFILPDIHRLDISVSYNTKILTGDLRISLAIINLYNRMNISSVYIGYHNNETVLKGICMIPFMPSMNIAYSF